jgi:hypothetical protein
MTRTLVACLLAVALAVSGCASVDPKAVESQVGGKSIAVAAALGDSLNLMWIGSTAFNNEYGSVPVGHWAVDEKVAAAAAGLLKSANRYSNVTIVPGPPRPAPGNRYSEDFLLLFEPETFQDRAFGTNQRMKGIGLYQRTAFGSSKRVVAHAGLKAEILDLRTGRSLGAHSEHSYWQVPQTLDTGPTISDEDLAKVRSAMEDRIATLVRRLVVKLGLGKASP